ncbi:class I adenylate-forming enzyme family protein [Amycolatopsis alkalitolerans]|uniref:AMP-binding protein n=1 Tax=Amycolatopsis alkalitolerans TaxID=2547244 RepID=A0A5C4LSZ7_9PSEU|nr:AMP-binding protein [Amycolatopsis alkalitolerans]TNC20224.1 AMP-binding protein [Amycolatopsis alkalitolerans]
MDLGTALRWTAERYPARRAVGGANPLSYAEWDDHTSRLASALGEQGVGVGDRVVLVLAGGLPLASLHLAAQMLGATSVPLSFRFGVPELAYCVADAAPALVIYDAENEELVTKALAEAPGVRGVSAGAIGHQAARAEPAPAVPVADTATSVMLYTSGTTGKPKGVPRSHSAEHYAALAHLIQSGQSCFDTTLGVMPLFHTMGMRTLLSTILTAGTWVPQVRFDAGEALELIVREEITTLYLVPTIYWALLRTGRLAEATSVRKIAYAGAAMTTALAERLAGTLRPRSFVNHFGSTEIYTFSIGPDAAAKPGSAGRAGVFSRVRLVRPEPGASPDELVGPGEQGQVAVSMASPEAFAGYWNRPDADAKTIREGWYFPGDLAVADEDGDLWVSGRVDDMINSGGENIYPDEVEDALVRCPAVREVVVAGTPDDRWGQAVTAFFVPERGTDPARAADEVWRFAREGSGLPSLKRPKRVIAVPEIPKSAVGKILRRELGAGHYEVLADVGENA